MYKHWNREWQPTPVFLLGEFHGQRNLVGYSPWSCKESDTTEQLAHTLSKGLSAAGLSYAGIQKKSVLQRGKSKSKGPKMGARLRCSRNSE